MRYEFFRRLTETDEGKAIVKDALNSQSVDEYKTKRSAAIEHFLRK